MDILDVATCVTPLSCWSSSSSNDGGVFYFYFSGSEGRLEFFEGMD
jgi:hypothetical protein